MSLYTTIRETEDNFVDDLNPQERSDILLEIISATKGSYKLNEVLNLNMSNRSLLYNSVYRGDYELFKLLLNYSGEHDYENLLSVALSKGYQNIVDLLIEKKRLDYYSIFENIRADSMINNQEFVEKIIEKCDTPNICKHLNSMIVNLTTCGSIKGMQIYWLYKLGKISREQAFNSKQSGSISSSVKDLIEQIEYLERLEIRLQGHNSVYKMSPGLFKERFVQRPVENDVMNKLIEELS